MATLSVLLLLSLALSVSGDGNFSSPNTHSRRLLQSACSTTDGSADAILRCTNAVRQNPSIMSDASCYARIAGWLASPRRNALAANNQLMAAAQRHNDRMTAANQMSHQLPGEPSLGARVRNEGYSFQGVSENLAWGSHGLSARSAVMMWLCSDGHRENMFSCNYPEIGVGVGNNYKTQVFGCRAGQNCNSCGGNPPATCPAYAGYSSAANVDHWGDDIGRASSVSDAAARCSADSACRGFNSDGWFKRSVTRLTAAQGYCLYTKLQAPASSWSTLRPSQVSSRNMCLDIAWSGTGNGVRLHQWACNGGPNQQFTLASVPNVPNAFFIKDRQQGRCIDVPGGSTTSGVQLMVWECNGHTHQQFYVEPVGTANTFRLRSRSANKCVDIAGGQQGSGPAAVLWDCNGGANQGFTFYSA